MAKKVLILILILNNKIYKKLPDFVGKDLVNADLTPL
jgi:hypothetical protein